MLLFYGVRMAAAVVGAGVLGKSSLPLPRHTDHRACAAIWSRVSTSSKVEVLVN